MELIDSRNYFAAATVGLLVFPKPIEVDGIPMVGRTTDAVACSICTTPTDMFAGLVNCGPV